MTSPESPRTERQKMVAGELYLSSDPELQAAMVRAMRLTETYNQISVDHLDERELARARAEHLCRRHMNLLLQRRSV